ncbi:MAG TPA: queuosine precursor transporter [Acidobacteriaceae bacterium]|jgi:hypothetical protein|nr:queuosine precursor transporter [Acidobacteriaceae bacterium]
MLFPSASGTFKNMPSQGEPTHHFKHLDSLTILFVVVLLVSNLVAQKICRIGPLTLSGAELLFPITYICGDIFTEVYGYAASRQAIWMGFFASGLLSVMGAIAVALPPAPGWHHQKEFATVFGFIPRLVVASLIAYWAGEFTNSYTLAKLKLFTQGRWLWTRTVGSTITGQAVDTAVVMLIAFWGQVPGRTLWLLIFSSYALKVAYEVLATPLTYVVIGWLKRSEKCDAFDREIDFNPFVFNTKGARQGESA